MPAVSIIIPVFNTHEFLRTCLDSVLGQTLRDIEVICVDDGSTDGSTDILREIADRDARVRLVFHAENKGVSAARNAGLAIATGDYVGFVDSDDTVCETYFASLYASCRANKADMAKGIYFSEDATVHAEQLAYNEKVAADKYAFTINFTTAVYRREMLVKNGIVFPEDTRNGEDIVFLIKAVHFANAVTSVPDAQYIYRQRDDSASRQQITSDILRNVMTSAEHVVDFITSVTIPAAGRDAVFCHIFLFLLYKAREHALLLTDDDKERILHVLSCYGGSGSAPMSGLSSPKRFERLLFVYNTLLAGEPVQRVVNKLYAAACRQAVCYFVGSLAAGGAERQCASLAAEMSKRGYCVFMLCNVLSGEKDLHYKYIIDDTSVVFVSYNDSIYVKKGLSIIKKSWRESFYKNIDANFASRNIILHIAGLLATIHPDVMHCYLDFCNGAGACAAIIAGVPVLLSFRSISPDVGGYEWKDFCYRLYRQAIGHPLVHLEANSQGGRACYAAWLDIPPEKIAYAPNGIESAAFSAEPHVDSLRTALHIPANSPVLVTLARFDPIKCPEVMLETFRKVHEALPDAHYLIAGLGMTADSDMGSMVHKLGLQEVVHLLGPQKDVAPVLSVGTAFLLSSSNEGMPNAVMEAMLSGLPIVATNVGAVPDLVRNGVDGFLYPVGESEKMADAVIRLFSNREQAAQMGASARERICCEFSLAALADRAGRHYACMIADAADTAAGQQEWHTSTGAK